MTDYAPKFYHKSFYGSIQYCSETNSWFGKATSKRYQNLIVHYEGEDVGALLQDFYTQVNVELEITNRK